ncbi:DNA mismatch repair protein MutS [Helcococcus kunzii]|uniref:DNA mismatch repair protein MutS n=1 Tax=Helcococcus kunzii TaxID=40091 RepID=UPI0024ADD5F5|nr:DNA mismatch repair protein MutS [Helcococcus kunzii]
MKSIDINKLTPMMQQYMKIKQQNMDKILFYRLGDFYEMFFDDAKIASKELELVLTGRECGLDEKAPMCGIPHHSANSYINRLVSKGYKVAIVEQVEDPSQAKGIVKRSVVKIISPGMQIDLDGKNADNNFLLSIYIDKNSTGISYIDISTGEFNTTEILNSTNIERDILDFISKVSPKEIVTNNKIELKGLNNHIEQNNIYLTLIDEKYNDIKIERNNIKRKIRRFNNSIFRDKYFSILSSSMLLDYVYLFVENDLNHIDELKYIENNNFVKIDASTRQNLEIHKNLYDSTKTNTLLNVLDNANTPMGSRKINSWLEFPLLDKNKINERLECVDFLVQNTDLSSQISDILDEIYDLERILSKVSYQNANGRDLLNFRNSISKLPLFKDLLLNTNNKHFSKIGERFDALKDLHDLIEKSIREDVDQNITEGNLIKEGYNKELDDLRASSIIGNKKLIEYEKSERERTGIPKLKVSFNKNVGYFIELTSSYRDKAPDNYIRRQTLKNSERFITDELNEIADMILSSSNETMDLEYQLFNEIRETVAHNSTRIKESTDIIATIDALNSFARVALKNNYCRPIFNSENYISISKGRHPVVEQTMDENQFIANDTLIGRKNKTIQIITGPNMAGKSTYMRQVALIVMMSQIGSYVPADSCDISISDAIFTRIGASDNLAKGDSTFMVEMKEMSNIIKNATENSFVILDEVGRGTSTYDGYSIAKSIIEYISKNINCKTLFATHYHELTDLEDSMENVENLKVEIYEEKDNIVFLRKIVRGKTDRSYGIEVAKLSGLPDEILFRANVILSSLDKNILEENKQLSFASVNEDNENEIKRDLIIKELKSIDIDNLTPMDALQLINSFKNKAKDITDD